MKKLLVLVSCLVITGSALVLPAAVITANVAVAQTTDVPGVPPDAAVVPTPAPTDADAGTSLLGPAFQRDLTAFITAPSFELGAQLLLHAIMSGAWGLVVSLIIVLVVLGLRNLTPEQSKFGQWLRSRMGGLASNFTLSLGLGFVTQFASGAPFSAALVLKAVSIALQAAGGWAVYKNIREAVAESKAKKAGEVATEDPKPTLDK